MKLQELTWLQFSQLHRATPIVIPIAAMEQHGHHLPLFTDSLLLGEVVRRVESELEMDIIVAPLMWLGNSDHHIDFPGTMSASPRVYLDILCDLMNNFIRHGFTRLLLLNGHGGNDVPARQAVFEVRQNYRDRNDLLLLSATYWEIPTPQSSTVNRLSEKTGDNRDAESRNEPSELLWKQNVMGHACEWETSMILRIRPDLVGDYQSLTDQPHGNPFLPANRGWITKDRADFGHIGSPSVASSQKGELLFERFKGDAVDLIRRVLAWDGSSWNG